jgi:hypothetical protein
MPPSGRASGDLDPKSGFLSTRRVQGISRFMRLATRIMCPPWNRSCTPKKIANTSTAMPGCASMQMPAPSVRRPFRSISPQCMRHEREGPRELHHGDQARLGCKPEDHADQHRQRGTDECQHAAMPSRGRPQGGEQADGTQRDQVHAECGGEGERSDERERREEQARKDQQEAVQQDKAPVGVARDGGGVGHASKVAA